MPGRSILLLSMFAPPATASAARRPAGLTKYLSQLGHRVTVLTSNVSGSAPIAGAHRVVRTGDLMTSRLNWRRANVEAVRGSTGGASVVAAPSRIEPWVVPDVQFYTWLPYLYPKVKALAREEGVEVVISTGPPHSTHLVAAALARKGVVALMELRDGWTYERGGDPFAWSGLEAIDRFLERRALSQASWGIGISEPLAADMRERLGIPAVALPLAYDPDEMASAQARVAAVAANLLTPGRHSMVYTGSIIGTGASAYSAVEAMAIVKDEHPDVWERMELVIAGPVLVPVRERIAMLGLEPTVRLIPSVDRVTALALQRAADSLLVLCNERRTSILTNKFVEYLVAQRPLLVLGHRAEAGRITRERRAGLVVDPTDPIATANAIVELVSGRVPEPSSEGLEDYSYPVVAARFADLIEEALSRGSSSSSHAGSTRLRPSGPVHPGCAPR